MLKFHVGKNGALVVVDSMDQSKTKAGRQKVTIMMLHGGLIVIKFCVGRFMAFFFGFTLVQTLRRLAQNREPAKKSRLRKIVILPC